MNKVSKECVESNIVSEWYTVVPGGRMTLCVLTTECGFQVTGESSCVDPAEFNEDLGREYSKEMAFNKLWEVMSYNFMVEKSKKVCKHK